jgi:acid stress-induced BolA-like protein IbaG/YrbA
MADDNIDTHAPPERLTRRAKANDQAARGRSLDREADSRHGRALATMNSQQIADLIRAGLPGAEVRVQSDDDTHFQARIVAEQFAGKRSIARHQLVYQTLGERMGREIHALSIEALTPAESGRE